MNQQQFVVITRPEKDSAEFAAALSQKGLAVFSYPTIAISHNPLTAASRKIFASLADFDWIIFTSKNGVTYFMDALQSEKIDATILDPINIAAVGPVTEEVVRQYGQKVQPIPSRFTVQDLAESLIRLDGKKILIPTSTIAPRTLVEMLEQKGALVTSIPIYDTSFVTKENPAFLELLQNGQIRCLTFTSPSTVVGFMQSMSTTENKIRVRELPVLAIGSVTAKKAKEYGFKQVVIPASYTTDSMLEKLQQFPL